MRNRLLGYLIILLILDWTMVGAQVVQERNAYPPSRQVHLDFHTSEHIPAIGQQFDKKQFQEALRMANVNQVNVFAKCCHSWSYYPTRVGKMHPNLSFDLLGAQLEACKEIGVKAPIYYIVGWSTNDANDHPEWCARKRDGSFIGENYDMNAPGSASKPFNSWRTLCWLPGGDYHKHILKQVEELCQRYKVDGFWFDMYHILPRCYCYSCVHRYSMEGVDMNNHAAVEQSVARASKQHMAEIRSLVAKYHPDASVFFNATPHVNNSAVFTNRLYELNTQQELEDLPTTWGGYDKLPLEAKFHLGKGSSVVAMSGKFHKAWGEFGGFKHPDAIKYEAAAMIANGASCNFGDQLHPSGKMDMDTYRNIGEAYKYVEKIEQYGLNGKPYSRLGLWLSMNEQADRGIVNMLLEMHYDFVVADTGNLDDLEVLVIPSQTRLGNDQAKRINEWVNKGGKLISFGKGLMDSTRTSFLIDAGVRYVSDGTYSFDYIKVKKGVNKHLVSSPFLAYKSGLKIKAEKADVLAGVVEPYFGRTYSHYSSHRETPYRLVESDHPAVVRHGNVVYFSHDLDLLYYSHAARVHRQLFQNALDLLYQHPALSIKNLPSAGRVSFLKQSIQDRYVAHLLYSPPLQRGEVIVIEDFPKISDVVIEVRVPEKIRKVFSIPDNKPLSFSRSGDLIRVKLSPFSMHVGIVMEY
ncbi:hypothetical protein L0U88_03580 [Flavihumibacter sp. RY-1]|uniref:Beta-galactosidase trimerisation domain-containing protein n=1 Tax=Flavihumibacter fluminis TaxID=2909236 RepID=A0ABS9BEH1_9BACT|nr:alpha-amylase family protein [Flavihumibacter fluminis]MCF1713710.1 hypothetical protein [Flavihumibacter fluminis]